MLEPLAPANRNSRLLLLTLAAALCGLVAPVQAPAVAAAGQESTDRASYILFAEGSRSTTMSGSMDDLRSARALRAGEEALLYVRQGGAAYVVRDPATLRRAAAIFEPQQAMGARQAELGSRQAALGSRQAALGAQQARLGARQAGAPAARAAELGRQQAALGRRQDELGRDQKALGDRQSALGREQSRLAREAESKLRALVADAIGRGLAQRVD